MSWWFSATLSFSDDESAEDDKRRTVTSFDQQHADAAHRNRSEPRSNRNAADHDNSLSPPYSAANISSPHLHNALYGYMFADTATSHSVVKYVDDDDDDDVYAYSKPEAWNLDDDDDVYGDKKKVSASSSKLKRDDRRQGGGRRQKHIHKEEERDAEFDPEDRRSRVSSVSRLQEFGSDSSRTSSSRDLSAVRQQQDGQLLSWVPGDLPGPPPKTAASCEELHCAANGRCVHDSKTGGGRCLCPLGTQGQYCERGN